MPEYVDTLAMQCNRRNGMQAQKNVISVRFHREAAL
jgi:hypothetical protein